MITKNLLILMLFFTLFIIFGGLLTLAIIYDGIYIQLVFDFGVMVVSALIGYFVRKKIDNP